MAITNGTFNTDLTGWNNNNASAYEVEVVWDNGRARLTKRGSNRTSGCGAPWMSQRFLIDKDFLSYDWETYRSYPYGDEMPNRWSLTIHNPGGDITPISEVIPSVTGNTSGNKNVDVSTYKGLEATISFWNIYSPKIRRIIKSNHKRSRKY